jgi:ribose 5-phosphate isomerase B
MKQIIAIAADHAGVELKNALKEVAVSLGHEVNDLGTNSTDSVDYPDYADLVANAVLEKKADRGILICGSGIGMSIAANRHKGIRAALVSEPVSATLSRKHNDSNILVLGARTIGVDVAKICVRKFLDTEFEGGRHEKRIHKLG